MKVLKFKISGKFWHFRKFYTTTSPLTFSIMPFTVIRGLIAWILGKEKNIYNEEFSVIKIAQEVNFDTTKKKMFWLNLTNTKTWEWHIQVKMETLINPCYTIYVADENFKEYEKLKEYLEKNYFEYTPYLWIATFIWKITYLGEFVAEKITENNVSVDSIIPVKYAENWKNLQLDENVFFEIEKVPFAMWIDRSLKKLEEFVFDAKWGKLSLNKFNWYKVWESLIYII